MLKLRTNLLLLSLLLPTVLATEWSISAPADQSTEGLKVDVSLPHKSGSVRFMVVGDTGTGKSAQLKLAETMVAAYAKFPFEFVLMMGDNLYGSERPSDYRKKFEEPYKPLLDAGVKFYAALGNHDEPQQRLYELFNMKGERYYSFKVKDVKFFALDSTYMSPEQLEWIEKELKGSKEDWKICFFHHPIYSSGGRHGSDVELRKVLEPLFVQHGVDAVFAGHEHFYERLKPQKQIYYFTSGAGGKLRRGDLTKGSPLTAVGFDKGQSFMLLEISGDEMHFQTLTTSGATVDKGTLVRSEKLGSPQNLATEVKPPTGPAGSSSPAGKAKSSNGVGAGSE